MKLIARVPIAIAVTVFSALGIQSSYKMVRADVLSRRDTVKSLSEAIELIPDEPRYYMRLALLDDSRADQSLEAALRVAPYNAQAAIELGLRAEGRGEYPRAEQYLLGAFDVDRTYIVRWTLANYYFRRDNLPAFWKWARRAAELPAYDIGPLLALCWRAEPDVDAIAKHVLTDDPSTIAQFLAFALARDQVHSLLDPASRLIAHGEADKDLGWVLAAIDRMIAASDAESSTALWRLLKARGWIVADDTVPNNARFARVPVRGGFDWKLPSVDGMHSVGGPAGLEVEFSGKESESCTVAEQMVVAPPGRYGLRYLYRTENVAPGTGLRWQVADARSGAALGTSVDLSSNVEDEPEMAFAVPEPGGLVRLRLDYQRSAGTTRIRGMVTVRSVRIEAANRSR